ncbi:Uu.00g061540.m01.CDS01 [Anthostomella pinea]|uniref:peptidyl-tRNA hydrolase n=1 Tax=Anthostomella pinea TaxID=933095 RepID=A0AAI8VT48_9PEZI|nr:Uu.00g061540.m01.CDS01 [Anthostomella pinea]
MANTKASRRQKKAKARQNEATESPALPDVKQPDSAAAKTTPENHKHCNQVRNEPIEDSVTSAASSLANPVNHIDTPLLGSLPERPFSQPSSPVRLFIASLGNPAPYQNSRHSAGHILLHALQSHLGLPSFKRSKPYARGFLSLGADVGRPELTLWQSPASMNVSGSAVLKAYKHFVSTVTSEASTLLVVLHDEMEAGVGQLKVRRGFMSAKGHNGIKSVQQSLQSAGLMKTLLDGDNEGRLVKIGIGIGRPSGGTRAKDDVSAHVLADFTHEERMDVEGSVGRLVGILEDESARVAA